MFGLLSRKRSGFRAEYDRDVEQNLARPIDTPPLAESDLAPLPPAVQRYIRLNGAVGQSRVRNFRARFHGQIRSGPNARWMSFTGEQHNFYGAASGPSRFFLMDASMLGIPFRVYHRYVDAHATMRVKAASLLTMVDAKGPDMDAAETVTVFNDLCVFAPGALVDHDIQWREIGSLLPHLGASVESLSGTRVRMKLNGHEGVLHRPHGGSTLGRQDILHLREYLAHARVTPSLYEAGKKD